MHRKLLALVAVLGLLLPTAGFAAQDATRGSGRGIVIGQLGLESRDLFGASVRWDRKDLKGGKANALSLSLVASDEKDGVPVFVRPVTASAKRPTRDYVLSLNPAEQALVQQAEGIGVVATQRFDLDGGLYDRAWVAGAGELPLSPSDRASRCSPVQPWGMYAGCQYNYADLSNMDVGGANFTGAQFEWTQLVGTNFDRATLTYAQLLAANMTGANLSGADLTSALIVGANLTGANLDGAILTGAQFCNTTMPDGTINNDNC